MGLPEFFQFHVPTKIIFGEEVASDFGVELEEMGVEKPLIVTDKVIEKLGLADYVVNGLEENGVEVGGIFNEVPQDSSVTVVNRIAELYKRNGCDGFIAIGGGSVIDSAKGANIVVGAGGDLIKDHSGAQTLTHPLKPLIAIPTTSGTGSEVTTAAVIYNEETQTKMEFIDKFLPASLAVLDPNMTKTLPPLITAATGMDALTHAIEAFVDVDATPLSDMYAEEAMRIIVSHLVNACANGEDVEERGWMMLGSTIAGAAFSHSECGVVHGIAHSLGGLLKIPHGIANAIILPFGMEYNLSVREERFSKIANIFGVYNENLSPLENGRRAIQYIKSLKEKLKEVAGLPTKLREVGVDEKDFPEIIKKTLIDGTSIYNPREETEEGILEILKNAF